MFSGYESIFALLLVLVLVAIILRPILNQFSSKKKYFYQSIGGLLPLVLLNLFGSNLNLHLPINFATIVIAAVLGLPGVILMLILKILLLKG